MMGHLNVQFYVDKAGDGLVGLSHHLGLGPAAAREAGVRPWVRDHHIRFLREQRPGAPLTIVAGVLEAGRDHLRIYEEMRNTASGEVAATFVADVVLLDAHTREPVAVPEHAREAAARFMMELPQHAQPRGLVLDEPRPAPDLHEAEANGMVRTYMATVKDAMCEPDGYMSTRAYMGVVSDAVPNLLAETRREDRSRTSVGGAALEYRFVYRQAPRPGDLLVLRTGIKDIGNKAYTFCHWMFDVSTGRAVATAEAVAVALDLEQRKAIAIPDTLRASLERIVVPGLGA